MDNEPNTPIDPGEPKRLNGAMKVLRIALAVLVIAPALLGMIIWSAMAIYSPSVSCQPLRTILAWAFGLGFLTAFVCLKNRRRTAICLIAVFALTLIWWLTLTPRNDRDWDPQVAVPPNAVINGDLITVSNIRNFEHRSATDYTPRYYEKTYDLSKIQTLDFIICYWGDNRNTAHSMLSFGFADGEYLCLSVEARRNRGEEYSGIGGLFRKYELIYILADERDMIRMRTNFRQERVYLYPLISPPKNVRTLFLDIIKRVNELKAAPEFYNTITNNCTTTLATSGRKILPPNPFDIRLLLNGRADRMAYDNGWINTKDSFEATRKRHFINQYVKGEPNTKNFSQLIRPHLSDQ